jgi:hypothetical protein
MNARYYLPTISLLAALLLAFGPKNAVYADRLTQPAPVTLAPAGQSDAILSAPLAESKAIPALAGASSLMSRNASARTTTVIQIEPLKHVAIGDPVVVTAHLTSESGAPLKNQPIRVYAYKNRVAQGVTDASGVARIPLQFNFYPGNYRLVVAYAGSDRDGLGPSDTSTMLVMVPGTVQVRTVPAIAGVQFRFNDQSLTTDSDGYVQFSIDHVGTYHIEVLPIAQPGSSAKIEFDRWNNNDFSAYHEFKFPVHRVLQAGFLISYPVNLRYTDKANQTVDPARISLARVRTAGTFYSLKDPTVVWLPSNSILHRVGGVLESKEAIYYLDNITIAGANVVNQGQQRFRVGQNSTWWIQLFLYSARFTAHDALFRFPVGSGILLEYPDGARSELSFTPANPVIQLDSLPRGIYHASVQGTQGLEPRVPLALSRGRDFELIVISRIDMAILLGTPVLVALLFLVVGRSKLFSWLAPHPRAAS